MTQAAYRLLTGVAVELLIQVSAVGTKKLTKTTVEDLPVAAKDACTWDTLLPRFGVKVTPAGTRIYLVQYRAKGVPGAPAKTRRLVIGQHGKPWTVDTARAEAKVLLAAVDLGRDPFAERIEVREARQRAAEAAAEAERAAQLRQRDNFAAVVDRYVAACLTTNRSGAETERLLRYDAVPVWRDLHIGDVRRADLADLLDSIKKRSPAVARSTYAALRGLFSWCVERDLIAVSPIYGLTAPPRPEARDRVLSDDELRLVWNASGELGFPFGPIIRLLILTGQRRAEVAGMMWSELDLEDRTWRIPKERSKNGKAHEVDLSDQAVAILKEVTAAGSVVFPARGEGAARGFSATKRRLDSLIEGARRKADASIADDLPPWRLHDLRRTAATGMAALGIAPHIVERVLNHISGTQSGLVGVYQRHEYRAERKAAIVAWDKHVEAVVSRRKLASNVHALRA